jgi:hypothetical protein
MFEMVMARAAAIACGNEDAIDLDRLRHDLLMKLAVGRCPDSGAALASQSTISRLENAPRRVVGRAPAARAQAVLDTNAAPKAYRIVRDAVPPNKENLRVEQEFTAGWIAFRFLKDPTIADHHFARIAGTSNPITLARAGYWRGRAAEAMAKPQEARTRYKQAARYSTAYYGQLARAKLGLSELALASSPLSEADASGTRRQRDRPRRRNPLCHRPARSRRSNSRGPR